MASSSIPDLDALQQSIEKRWDESIVPTLCDFIRIPNQSPFFDSQWATNGFMDQAIALCVSWAEALGLKGFKLRVVRDGARTPCLFAVIDASSPSHASAASILMYSHLDKQPPLTADWEDGLGPYTPVIRNGRLYGRGGADDGYGLFAALAAVKALQEAGVPHGRLVLMTEACEESGSIDLPYYVETLADEIGPLSAIVCLDSGAGNYDQLWMTTSLRGAIAGTLRVKILNEGCHSGAASGVVPSSFRIIRMILDRVEDAQTGKVAAQFHTTIPEHRLREAAYCGEILGETVVSSFPFVAGARPFEGSMAELILNKTWRPTLSYIGLGGMPQPEQAGNVLRAETRLTVSMRLPPNKDPEEATRQLKALMEADPPYGAEVEFTPGKAGGGFDAPELPEWLAQTLEHASQTFWGRPVAFQGEGGSIPFMGMLRQKFPSAAFAVTGVLGPSSNAHGPNEFMDIRMAKNVCKTVALILANAPH